MTSETFESSGNPYLIVVLGLKGFGKFCCCTLLAYNDLGLAFTGMIPVVDTVRLQAIFMFILNY